MLWPRVLIRNCCRESKTEGKNNTQRHRPFSAHTRTACWRATSSCLHSTHDSNQLISLSLYQQACPVLFIQIHVFIHTIEVTMLLKSLCCSRYQRLGDYRLCVSSVYGFGVKHLHLSHAETNLRLQTTVIKMQISILHTLATAVALIKTTTYFSPTKVIPNNT